MAGQMMNKNTPRYPANYTNRTGISVRKCNHGNPSSGEPYYSPQSGQANSDDTIFRGCQRNCAIRKLFIKFCKIHKKTPVSELLFYKN